MTQNVEKSPNAALPRPVPSIMSLAADLPVGHEIAWHRHKRAQLIFAAAGLMRVSATIPVGEQSCQIDWLLPSPQALWMPAGVPHRILVLRAIEMRTLYLDIASLPPVRRARLPQSCQVLPVSQLLRALVLRLVAISPVLNEEAPGAPVEPRRQRLAAVLFDELGDLPALPLALPHPQDRRLRRVTDALRDSPGDQRSLIEWGRVAGASPRTLARLFLAETGLGFTAWRQQARFLQAIAWLAEHRPVTAIALDLGYDSPSAFIAVFKRTFGVTPGRYFARR